MQQNAMAAATQAAIQEAQRLQQLQNEFGHATQNALRAEQMGVPVDWKLVAAKQAAIADEIFSRYEQKITMMKQEMNHGEVRHPAGNQDGGGPAGEAGSPGGEGGPDVDASSSESPGGRGQAPQDQEAED